MTKEQKKLLDEALRLPLDARAALATQLIESLDESVDEDAEAAWAEEIAKRSREIDSGLVRPIPWITARKKILGRARAADQD